MAKKISELPIAEALGSNDVFVINHIESGVTVTASVRADLVADGLGVNGKVDKVAGKGLSTNDYDDTDKDIVDGVTEALAGKQDTISDLSTIRSGASAGATAYQKPSGGIPKTDLASAVQTSLGKADSAVQSHQPAVRYDTASQGLTDTQKSNARTNIGAGTSSFSGSYNDLSNKPTIPAEQIQSDWNQATTTAKDYIKNKPTLGTASAKDVSATGNASSAQVVMGSDTRLTDSRPASDVSAWAKASTKPSYTAAEVGAIATTAKGANGGVAELDSSGKVPSSQIPLGETSSTAYRGDRGKTAYDHSQTTSGNPHNVTKSDVGLGNVGNFKAVSTAASQGLTDTEKANARTNIGAGTSSFSGSYNDLTNKPTIPSAQVNSDWNATSGVAQILNKPTIPDVSGKADKVSSATSGDVATLNASGNLVDSGKTLGKSVPSDAVFTDTKNTAGSTDSSSKLFLIGATSQAANPQTYSHDTAYVGTDGCLYSGGTKVLTAHQSISGKADKVSNATSGNFAGLDSNGNLTDSGHKHSDYLTQHQDISGKLDKTTYEWNKDISFGSSGYLKIGSFPMGDTNLTIEVDSTTSNSYHGTVIIATQNVSTSSMGSAHSVRIYDDPYENIKNKFRVVWTSGSRNYDVYFVPDSWSKNLIHIRACNLYGEPSDICKSMSGTAPSSTTGLEPVNALSTKADKVSGATSGNFAGLDANGNLTDSGKKPGDLLTLGTSSSTAYRGDRGNTAYTHATETRLTTATAQGLYKVGSTAQGHISGLTAVAKSDITDLGIPAQDTTYESKSASSGGTAVSLCTTGEKYTWNNKQNKLSAMSQSEADTGTSTTGRIITAKVLTDTIHKKAHTLYGVTMLSSSADLNNYKAPTYSGEYYYNIAGHSISNMPTGLSGRPFRLVVESLSGSDANIVTGTGDLDISYTNCTLQTLIVTNTNSNNEVKTFRRTYNGNSWSAWVSYEDEIASLNSRLVAQEMFGKNYFLNNWNESEFWIATNKRYTSAVTSFSGASTYSYSVDSSGVTFTSAGNKASGTGSGDWGTASFISKYPINCSLFSTFKITISSFTNSISSKPAQWQIRFLTTDHGLYYDSVVPNPYSGTDTGTYELSLSNVNGAYQPIFVLLNYGQTVTAKVSSIEIY